MDDRVAADEEVRRQNWFRVPDVQSWREFELRWRTHWWWPGEWAPLFDPERNVESARWRLCVTPHEIHLEKAVAGRITDIREIEYLEAGELAVLVEARRPPRGPGYQIATAVGRSVDGRTSISLPWVSVRTGARPFDQVELSRVLVSWWPVNRRSRDALAIFEREGFQYWRPFGLAPGRRVTHAGEE